MLNIVSSLVRSRQYLFALLAFFYLVSGCGTLQSRIGLDPYYSAPYDESPHSTTRVYGGIAVESAWIKYDLRYRKGAVLPFYLFDLPLTLVADTLLLPVTFYEDSFTGKLALHAEKGDLSAVELLLRERTDPNEVNSWGHTALMAAAWANHSPIVDLLLRRGVHVDARSRFQKTALFYAAAKGNSTVVQLLLEHKADPNGKDYPITPLAIAAGRGDMETVRNLLDKKADMAAGIWHPLFAAVEKDHDEVVKLLLIRGADPNMKKNDGRTPLFYASCNGSDAIVTLLLANGARTTARSFVPEPYPSTPLDCAIKNGHASVVELFRRNSGEVR
jgi:ankyrin repeat protein